MMAQNHYTRCINHLAALEHLMRWFATVPTSLQLTCIGWGLSRTHCITVGLLSPFGHPLY